MLTRRADGEALFAFARRSHADELATSAMKKISIQNYQTDKYYPRIVRALDQLLEKENVVTPVDLFLEA